MLKSISFFLVPLLVYFGFSFIIDDFNNLLLVTFCVCAIIFWATLIIPEYQTALYFLFSCLLFHLASKEVIFSGFYSSAFWLVFAGMVITITIKNLNLDSKIMKFFNLFSVDSYLKILVLITLFNIFLCFLIPAAMSRVFITVPILLAICSNFGYEKDSKGYLGIILLGIITTSLPGFALLPANLPNMILSGLTENIYGFKLLYSTYFISNFLIFGILKSIVIIFLVYYFYNEESKEIVYKKVNESNKKKEKIVGLILLGIIILWLSDSFHKLSPSLVAILGVLVLVHPSLKIIDKKDLSSINLPTLIFVAGLIGLGNILANNEFVKTTLENIATTYNFSQNSSFMNYLVITIFTSISGIFLTQPTLPAVFTPIAGELATQSGFSLSDIFMLQVASFSNIFFVHQSPPMLIALQLAGLKSTKIIKVLLLTAIITTIFLYPIHYLWMKFI